MKTSTLALLGLSSLLVAALPACQKETTSHDPKPKSHPLETISGTGMGGAADGDISVATFNRPKSVTLDAAGNLYVADWLNQKVRKISTAGQVTTLAGTGNKGYIDGEGSLAEFNNLGGLTTDLAGNLIVADIDNHRIRRITPDGQVSTIAGGGTKGLVDGTSAEALFNKPRGVAVDGAGNIYVADQQNHCVRKITPDGTVSTLAGNGTPGFADGTGGEARFTELRDLSVDASGNVYVADTDNHRIRKITPAGVVTTIAGNGKAGFADGSAATALFRAPKGIAVDKKGNIYVADSDNHRIRKITPAGVVTTIAGNGTAGFQDSEGVASLLNAPRGIVLDAGDKNLYIADEANHSIRKLPL